MEATLKAVTEIFDMFLWNNVHQGRRFDLLDIMHVDKERQLRYTMAGKHYLASVSRTELWKGPCVNIVIRCPLPYLERQEGVWVPLPFMQDGIGSHFNAEGFWYSARPESVAFVLGPKDARMSMRHCKITFVNGGPFLDDDFEATIMTSPSTTAMA